MQVPKDAGRCLPGATRGTVAESGVLFLSFSLRKPDGNKYAERISGKDIAVLNIPTAIPMVYELEDDMNPIRRYYPGDQETVEKEAEAVADQTIRKD